MEYRFSDVVSIPNLQQMLVSFFSGCGITAEIVDSGGQVVAAAGQHLFEKFHLGDHRSAQLRWQSGEEGNFPNNGEGARRCELLDGFFVYACDIRVENQKIATLYLGPVFRAAPNEDRLRLLAREHGIDEAPFLQAAQEAPVVSEAQAAGYIALLVQLVQRLAEKGLSELRLTASIADAQARQEKTQQVYHELETRVRERTEELERVNLALQESEQRFRVALIDTPVVVFHQDPDLRYSWIYNPQNYAHQPIIGKTDADLFSAEDALRLEALKKRVMTTGLLTREEVAITGDAGTSFYDMTLDALYDANGAVAGLTCAATDITERKHIEEEMRKRLAESEGIQRIAKGLLQKIGLEEVLEIVCTEAMNLLGAKGSAVLLLDEDGWLKLTHRVGSPEYKLDHLHVTGSFAGQAVQTGSHVWVSRQIDAPDDATDQWRGYPWTPGLLSMLSVPLKVDLQTIGVLNILDKPGDLTEEDVRIINLFADQAAIIIEHVRLQRRAEQFAVLEERQRLARELHDSVTQALYGVTLYADAASLAFSRQQWEALERNLQEARNMAREAMYDMRLLVFELRPLMLEKEGVAAVLRARLTAVEARAGLKADLLVEGERRLPIGIEEQIYRIVQEGLTNVIKHAKASVVQIRLVFDEEVVHLEIKDDGLGFDPEKDTDQSGGMGLQGIQERVQQVGGRLEIESAAAKGTRLSVTIPTRALISKKSTGDAGR
ncbi:MAG: hypothetical protein B6D39_06325 [Anaerolineae bacterium UTCFX2]|jgi:nitrate/nitrite-specific signal transduction histidine kinase|nr:MAG: hypothetical protein B6D39_06325 [Anaerolineae bacterium UTCFX2]